MRQKEELTELLRTASLAIGDDLHADPATLISAARRRRRAAWLSATAAALVLLAAVGVPSLVDRDRRAFNVAAGDPNGGSPPESATEAPLLDPVASDPTSTTWAGTTVPPEPAVPPASAPPTTQVVPPAIKAPPVTGARAAPTVPLATVEPVAPPTTRGPAGEPELLSASGTVGRITLHFSRPVVPGDGPHFDRPTTTHSTDTYMAAMQLVSHMVDSTCSSPNGNAHEYLSGVGTDTITVEATSLVVGTTYISISPGFVKNPVDGTPMKWVRCLGITIR